MSEKLSRRSFVGSAILLSEIAHRAAGDARQPLESGFQSPPPECRPEAFYQVMGGQLTREGITRDFEAMERQGVGGAMLMQMPDQLAGIISWPFREYPGKIKCLSDEWFAVVNHAIGEADRLGLNFRTLPCPGWSHVGGPWVTPDKSGKILVAGYKEIKGPVRFEGVIPRPPLTYDERKLNRPDWASDAEGWKKLRASFGDFWREVAVIAYPADKDKRVSHEEIVDLTHKMDNQGRLTWDVPEGNWRVARLGLESFKEPNYPAQLEGSGLECDRMDSQAMHLVFDNYVGRMLRDARAKGYRAFKGFDTDSYESVNQDFSPDFPEQFKKRMGYDCVAWLPAWIDRKLTIDSPDLTARFRRDMQQVITELWLERFYAEIKRFAEANNIQWMIEPYFKLTIDWRTVASRSHVPGGEFWVRERPGHGSAFRDLIGPAPDAAALYGQPVVWAEAFTAGPENGAWRNDPWVLKPFGDYAFCRGVNHFVMHGFVHNPFGDRIQPGFSFGYWGTQLSRNVTWWPYSAPWHRYLARCAFMLRQGLPVADVLAYPPRVEHIPGPVLECAPYKQTVCNEEALLERVRVQDGRLVLPHGVSYAALALPALAMTAQRSVTPQALRRIRDLVNEGATLIGEPVPTRSVSLRNYPRCDEEMERLVAEIWGGRNVAREGERRVGKGRVMWGRPLPESLGYAAGGPDFEFIGLSMAPPPERERPRYDFCHRRTPETDIYFVANLYDEPIERTARFRVTGGHPELWDAVTGRRRALPEYRVEKGHTFIPMRLAARQSCFVVFAGTVKSEARFDSKSNFPLAEPAAELEGPWQVAFDPKWGGPEQIEFAALEDWTRRPEPGIQYYSGTALYRKTFDAEQVAGGGRRRAIYLDLGKVKNLARVRLNGKDLGIVWCAPWRVEITEALNARNNRLEIEVVNLWVNRVLGDEQEPADVEMVKTDNPQWKGGYLEGVYGMGLKDLPDWLIEGKPRPSKRYTFINWQFYPKDAPLLESGLIGPVRILLEE
ncbi:MAG: hypothetical protein M1541_08605 [Acidobacteria bacterium]|nr:hypothetical protein [Acidobacteriota bacterium]